MSLLRATIAATSLAAIGIVTACLGTLPEAATCPPDPAYPVCPLHVIAPPGVDSGPAPPVLPTPPMECPLAAMTCLQEQRRSCACTSDTECTKTASTCTPAPDCPTSVRSAIRGATCIDVKALAGPVCICGCASCAATCDGKGPILGPGETMRFDLPASIGASGKLGVMVRARGGGRVSVAARSLTSPTPIALGEAPADSDFTDNLARILDSRAEYSWNSLGERPVVVELHSDPTAAIEVDCVVPFVTR